MSEPVDPNNPFKGTPFEALFNQMGMPGLDLSAIMSQMQRMFEPHEGTVNYAVAKDVARQALSASGPDPSVGTSNVNAATDAASLADLWLGQATHLTAAPFRGTAWSRAEWIENTMDSWQVLVEPIASTMVSSMGEALPQEAQAFAGPLMGMMAQAGGAMFGQQIGAALAELATEVLSSTEIGLPLGPAGTAAVIPHNIAAFGEGLEHKSSDLMLFVMLREVARLRLFGGVQWLRPALITAIEEFGRGTRIDISGIESGLMSVDPSNPANFEEIVNGGLFEPQSTPEQEHAKERLELLLALIEGWVDEVVTQATQGKMPAAGALAEMFRRRRASGGPAEQTFASLVGLELRPRRLRDAANLWSALRDRLGPDGRDAVWSHPDLVPTSADLDDLLGFVDRRAETDQSFDDALEKLLEEGRPDAGNSDS